MELDEFHVRHFCARAISHRHAVTRQIDPVCEPSKAADAVRYHYIIIDYVAVPTGGTLQAGSDAAEARWVPVAELSRYKTTEGLAAMVNRAVKLRHARTQGGLIG